jgi:hypothetical protein
LKGKGCAAATQGTGFGWCFFMPAGYRLCTDLPTGDGGLVERKCCTNESVQVQQPLSSSGWLGIKWLIGFDAH